MGHVAGAGVDEAVERAGGDGAVAGGWGGGAGGCGGGGAAGVEAHEGGVTLGGEVWRSDDKDSHNPLQLELPIRGGTVGVLYCIRCTVHHCSQNWRSVTSSCSL